MMSKPLDDLLYKAQYRKDFVRIIRMAEGLRQIRALTDSRTRDFSLAPKQVAEIFDIATKALIYPEEGEGW